MDAVVNALTGFDLAAVLDPVMLDPAPGNAVGVLTGPNDELALAQVDDPLLRNAQVICPMTHSVLFGVECALDE